MNNTNTPTREAIVLVSHDSGATFVPALDLDPIDLAISDGLADAFDPAVIGLSNAILDAESTCPATTEYRLVWSDDRSPVKATCPVCDDFFNVSEGAPGDELNEGYDAVFCGCDPADA